MPDESEFQWDAFTSYASEDKGFVESLVAELQKYGLTIWFGEFSLKIGDSLRESIDHGLAKSCYGIIVLSPSFFAKRWPQQELNALFAREICGRKVILPIRHQLGQEDLLQYSPMLADRVSIDSATGIPAVARALVDVIRPEAFHIETSRADTAKAATRLRDQLREKEPRLDYRITFGPQDPDQFKNIAAVTSPDAVAATSTNGMRIEAFAIDKETYNQNPLSVKVQIPFQARTKLEELYRKGTPVELGPDDDIKVSSDVFSLFGSPDAFTGVQKFIAMPSTELMRRRFRFKITFARGDDREEYPFVEFQMVRPGSEEIEILSCGPSLPFQLTLTWNLVSRDGGAGFHFSYAGHEIRKIYKAHRALQLLFDGGTLEVWDLDSDRPLSVLRGANKTSADSDADRHLDQFISALHEVATAFNETIHVELDENPRGRH